MKKLFSFISVFIIILITIFSFNRVVIADSGWDSDYDSGGSDWSSSDSDWDSGSDWDYGGDWDSSSSSSEYNHSNYSYGTGDKYSDFIDLAFNLGLFLIGILLLIFMIIIPNRRKPETYRYNSSNYDLNGNDLELFNKYFDGCDINKFKDKIYNNFVDVQNAWMNFDYDKLSKLCSNELFNEYKDELEILKLKKQKNIMSDFVLNGFNLISIFEDNGVYRVTVNLSVSFYDYVVDSNEKVVRGFEDKKLTNVYRLTYEFSNNGFSVCPNCGSKITGSNKCEYCGSIISNNFDHLVLTIKKRI